ncbi:MAG: sugar phosphate isomerase/epimerase family protein [Verrucomicrobiota bacterium]
MERRRFIKGSLTAGAVASAAPLAKSAPLERSGDELRVALAAYSFRSNFAYMKGKPNRSLAEGARTIDMPGFIRYCAELGVDGAELTSYFFPPEVSDDYLANCRRTAHINGVAVAGTAVGNNFSHPKDSEQRAEQMAYVQSWVDRAVVMGAPHVRVFAGVHPKGMKAEEAEANAIEALREAADYAGARGIILGIENHDSVGTAEALLRIVKAVDHPWLGVNLDSGNFRVDDPFPEIAASVPYAVNVQLKTEFKKGDEKVPADLERVVGLLRDGGYAGHVVLEYEEKDDPFEHVPRWIEKLQGWCA